MSNCITLGNYNRLFKYLFYHIIAKFILEYIIENFLPKKTSIFDKDPFPERLFIQEGFNYLGTFICSLFLIKYETTQARKNNNDNSTNTDVNFKSKTCKSTRARSFDLKLIYHDYEGKIFQLSNIFIIFLLFICIQLKIIFYSLSLKGLDFWVPELIFVCIFTNKFFDMPIYLHKKFAIYFILIFSGTLKTLTLIFRFIDDPDERLYKIYKWITPIGIAFYILLTLLRSYTFCKIKFLFHLKFVLSSKFLALYSCFGTIICLIISIITTKFSCGYKTDFKNINLICMTTKDNNEFYYDNYSIFFKALWDKDRENYINIIYITIFLIKIILSFGIKLFGLLIINKLNPEYLICSNSIYSFIIDLFDFFVYIFSDDQFRLYKLFGTLAQFASIFGTIIYLELFELNFWNLNHDLKRNIEKRGLEETNLALVNDENEENRASTNEIEGDENKKTEMSKIS